MLEVQAKSQNMHFPTFLLSPFYQYGYYGVDIHQGATQIYVILFCRRFFSAEGLFFSAEGLFLAHNSFFVQKVFFQFAEGFDTNEPP